MPNNLTPSQQVKLDKACRLMQKHREESRQSATKRTIYECNSIKKYSEIIDEIASPFNPDVIIVTSGSHTNAWDNDPATCLQSYPIYARDLVALEKNVVIINIDPVYGFENFYIQPDSHVNIFNIPAVIPAIKLDKHGPAGIADIPSVDFFLQSFYPIIKKWLSESKKVIFHSHNAIITTPLSTKLVASLFDDPTINHDNIEIIAGYFSTSKRNFILTNKTQADLSTDKEKSYTNCIIHLDKKLTEGCMGSGLYREPSEENLHIITSELRNIGWAVCPEDSLLHMVDVPILASIAAIEA